MELGVDNAKLKLHGKEYFLEFLDSLPEVPPSVVELLYMPCTSLEVFTEAHRKLLDRLTRYDPLRERVELIESIGGGAGVTASTYAKEGKLGSVRLPWRRLAGAG